MKLSLKLMSLLLCFITAVFSLTACKKKDSLITEEENLLSSYSRSSSVPTYNFRESADLMPENYQIYINASQDFSLDLLREVAGNGENTVLSPLAVSEMLALLSNGSTSQTSQNLRNTVGSTLSLSDLNLCNYYLRQRIQSISAEGTFYSTSSLWLNDRFDVKSPFLQTAADYFSTSVIRTDFAGDKFYDKLNGFVSEKTDGKKSGEISDIPSDYMMFAAADTLLLDGWLKPFDESTLFKGAFNGTSTTSEEIFMVSSESYISSDIAEGFTKSLKGTPMKFAAIMPKDDITIEEFSELLTASRLDTLLHCATPAGNVQIALPIFSSESDLSLKDTLSALGADRAFDPEKSNFSDMSSSDKVYLNDVLHYCALSVTPEGFGDSTDDYTAASQRSDAELIFSRPFIFMIYDNESAIPVLIGTVENIP